MIPIKDNIPTDRFPVVTVVLILANLVAYVIVVAHGGSLISGPDLHEIQRLGAVPYALAHGGHCGVMHALAGTFGCTPHAGPNDGLAWPETVLTSMFVHGSILHLAGNLLFLWIFGNTVEDAMGHLRFGLFYLLGGVAALALQTLVDPGSLAPTVGSAGAIAGVLGGYIVLYPRARVLSLVLMPLFSTVIEVPARVMLGLWIVVQAVFGATGLTSTTSGVVSAFAYVGGFLFGLLTIRLLATCRKETPPSRVMAVS